VYYAKLLNHSPSSYGSEVAYRISVRALEDSPTPGALVLVAGRLKENDELQSNIHNVTEAVYHMFLSHGYTDSRIYYLATDASVDGWDALPSQDNLEAAITTWAPKKVGSDRPLTVYLMDHGNHDRFYLDKTRGEGIEPAELDQWLDDLEAAVPGVKTNIIVDACFSGSFIELTETVSKPGRVVIASTGAWKRAWPTDRGAEFSDRFVAALDRDESLYASFENARSGVHVARDGKQTPWLDDDGDGQPNTAMDGAEAARRGFAFVGTFAAQKWPPYIVQAVGPTTVRQESGAIHAEVRDDQDVRRVWAVIYPPSYEAPEPGEEMIHEDVPSILLRDHGANWYGTSYTGFDEMGFYRVVIRAEDDEGIEARPLAIQVRTGWKTYLPSVLRSESGG
jgi:hypothetical protein